MGTPLCILLVDDSKFFLELERQFLRNTPAAVLTASSGEEAIALARKNRPSLVFMDIDMPGMNGLDCCRIFKSDQSLQGIPIILIGGKTSETDELDARSSGADSYLSKPLDRRYFLGAGHRFLVSIDRREPRQVYQSLVDFSCRGRRQQGRCIDVSSGGMFLDCQPAAAKGESLLLKFSLPDEQQTHVEIHGRIAWVNSEQVIIKEDYPLGYGIEFVGIPDSVGIALRRCFGT
ncbi:MAG: response regulator [Desulfobulbaceae bacterium]|nr:response regulator [Desulfobulbaceae bacterium]